MPAFEIQESSDTTVFAFNNHAESGRTVEVDHGIDADVDADNNILAIKVTKDTMANLCAGPAKGAAVMEQVVNGLVARVNTRLSRLSNNWNLFSSLVGQGIKEMQVVVFGDRNRYYGKIDSIELDGQMIDSITSEWREPIWRLTDTLDALRPGPQWRRTTLTISFETGLVLAQYEVCDWLPAGKGPSYDYRDDGQQYFLLPNAALEAIAAANNHS